MMTLNKFVVAVTLITVLVALEIYLLNRFNTISTSTKCVTEVVFCNSEMNFQAEINFTNFNNETGTEDGCYIVPNIIHYIRFGGTPMSYVHMICCLSAFYNHQSDKIYFHYDDYSTFSGKYWNILQNTTGFMDRVEFFYTPMPTEIYGQKLSEGWEEFHGSDLTRIHILMKYGGIFLDNDVYVVQSLNDFRRYEISLSWDEGEKQFLGSQILIAHKNARFLNLWIESYRNAYRSDLWQYNTGERPTITILYKNPELVHRVKILFGMHTEFIYKIYTEYWPFWRSMYTIHLLNRHLDFLESYEQNLPKKFSENNVKAHENTFREMALRVYNPDNSTFKYKTLFD